MIYIEMDYAQSIRATDPCLLGRHRWAWLVDGRQACGYCGVIR